jgi:hypothetical protein
LSTDEIKNVVELTAGCVLDDKSSKKRQAQAKVWVSNPTSFWGFSNYASTNAAEFVEKCCSYEDGMKQEKRAPHRLRCHVLKEMVCLSTCDAEEHYRGKQDVGRFSNGITAIANTISQNGNGESCRERIQYQSRQGRRWLLLGRGRSLGVNLGQRYYRSFEEKRELR